MKEYFSELVKNLGLNLDDQQLEQFDQYYELLIEWNSKINLTSIIDEKEVYSKHFYDSLCFTKAVTPSTETLLDVGSGAGFPSIPLLIAYPKIKVTIIDAQLKRIKFLEELTKKLHLQVKLIHGRAEEFHFKNHFDLVTARAVSNMQILTELCLPFVKVGGLFVALKGPSYIDEVEMSRKAIHVLGGEVSKIVTYQFDELDRSLIIIKKNEKTNNAYPRKYSQIKKNPL